MTIKTTIEQIQEIIDKTPYTREEIAFLWKEEAAADWEPETIMAYGAALDYLHRTGQPESEHLRQKYNHLLDELKEQYSERIHPFTP